MNEVQKRNEKNCPDLIKLRKIALSDDERRVKAAYLYLFMTLALNKGVE